MLELTNISAGYGNKEIIKNISIKVNNGENLSIIGPNGSGKTTLLKAIANSIPSKGLIEIDGKPISKMKHKEFSLKIAMMSQISNIYFSFSVFETVMLGRYLHIKKGAFSYAEKNDVEIVNKYLKLLNLYDLRKRQITELSGGQLQKVYLARTLVQEPDIILLDEPTNHLDLKFQTELISYLKKWSVSENKIVIGILHDINLAIELSDNILLLNNGTIEVCGKVKDVLNKDVLNKVYDMDIVSYMIKSLKKWESIVKRPNMAFKN